MFDHHPSDELLNEYFDNLLRSDQREVVAYHLTDCKECTLRVEALILLYNDLKNLPEIELTRDLTGVVLRSIRPSLAMPRRWGWAVMTQFSLAGLLLLVSLPVILRSEAMQGVNFFDMQFLDAFDEILAAFFNQGFVFLNRFSNLFSEIFQAFQQTDLPFSIVTLGPVVLATGVLWLVGNGLLLRNQLSESKKKRFYRF